MTNRKRFARTLPTLGALIGLGLAGCGEEQAAAPPPAPVAAKPAAPAAPPKPKVTPVADLMAQLRIDERVDLPEDKAPASNEQRIAVLEFFDAFARGDADALRPMLESADRAELDAMVDGGSWSATVPKINEIIVETGTDRHGDTLALALFDVDGKYQPQLWAYRVDRDGVIFEAMSTPPNVLDQLSGLDWIAKWLELIDQEMEIAMQTDAVVEIEQINLDENSSGGGPTKAASPGGGGSRPIGRRPPRPGGKRKPVDPFK